MFGQSLSARWILKKGLNGHSSCFFVSSKLNFPYLMLFFNKLYKQIKPLSSWPHGLFPFSCATKGSLIMATILSSWLLLTAFAGRKLCIYVALRVAVCSLTFNKPLSLLISVRFVQDQQLTTFWLAESRRESTWWIYVMPKNIKS